MRYIISLFQKKSVFDLASKEMDEAQRALLMHQRGSEFHAQMIKYYENKITRLGKMLCAENK